MIKARDLIGVGLVIGLLAVAATIMARSQVVTITPVSGPPGPMPNFSLGTVTPVPYGTSPAVTVTGTQANPIMNFWLEGGQGGTNGTNGTNGNAGPAGATGPQGPGGILCYRTAGVISGCKQWMGTATINASGNWTVNISSAGFSSVLWTQFTPISTTNSGLLTISGGSCTATSCSGTASGALNILGVLVLSLNNINGSVVAVQVVGN